MGRIGSVSAMHEESQALLAQMPDEAPVVRGGRRFWVGHLAGREVVAVLSGIGKSRRRRRRRRRRCSLRATSCRSKAPFASPPTRRCRPRSNRRRGGAVRTIFDSADDAAHVDFGRFVEELASRHTLVIVRGWLAAR